MSLRRLAPMALLACCLSASPGLAADAPPENDPWFQKNLPPLLDLYRHLHSHPELSFREFETARRIADELKQAGAEVTTGVGGLGVVGLLRNGQGPIVLVRSDLDALPVSEETGLPYASHVTMKTGSGNVVGVMHACGHDIHMTCLVGTARWLAEHRDRWSGTVVLIGQPAEEAGDGAHAMLSDGLYTRFPRPNFALALHVAHDLEAGKVGYCVGPAMASVTSVDLIIKGKGGHGAMPDTTIDPIVLAATLVLDMQTIVSREIRPIDPAVLTVGAIQGGSRHNVIPDEVRLQLTLRAFRNEVRDQMIAGIQRRVKGLTEAHNAPEPIIEVSGTTPPTVNTPSLVEKVMPALARELSASNIETVDPTMAAEDFGMFGQDGVPTFMFRLGTVSAERIAEALAKNESLPSLHSPLFQPDPEPTVRTGVRAMSAAVLALLPPSRPLPAASARAASTGD